jgi:DNA-binding transcriptional regulator of glucitol operon
MNWLPIWEYLPEMHTVLVWLQWTHYSDATRTLGNSGQPMFAYRMSLNEGAVWVDAKDCVPIESAGRRVTHFMQPQPPENRN